MFSCKFGKCFSAIVRKQMTCFCNDSSRFQSKFSCFSWTAKETSSLIRILSVSSRSFVVSRNERNELRFGFIHSRRHLSDENVHKKGFDNPQNNGSKGKRRSRGRRFLNETNSKLRQTKQIIQETREKVKEKVEEIIMRENISTVPNFLCATRIVMSPVLGYLVLNGSYEVALALFVVAGITDLLDGYIARNFENQRSMFGSFLDPFADKLLVFCLMLSLTVRDLIPVPLTSLIVFRDVVLVVAGFYIRYLSLPPPKTFTRYFDPTLVTAQLSPTFISKANTTLQLVLVAATLTSSLLPFDTIPYLRFLWYLTATTTVASGLSYVTSNKTYKLIQQIKNDKRRR